jgi:hypothetical protein
VSKRPMPIDFGISFGFCHMSGQNLRFSSKFEVASD